MNPYRIRTGDAKWLESVLTDFKFRGTGWYDGGKILVMPYHGLYQAYQFHEDPRPQMRKALELANVVTPPDAGRLAETS
jgi:hypothetical protein